MRLFIAVDCPQELKSSLSQFLKNSFQTIPQKGMKWVRAEHFHLTLRFLGEVEESRVQLLEDTLTDSLGGVQSFSSKFTTFGFFPSSKRARIFWIGLDDSKEKLANLAKKIEEGLIVNNFGKSDKEFSAHLTLARFSLTPLPIVLQQIEKIKSPSFAELKISQVLLMQSVLQPEGPHYVVLKQFLLVHADEAFS
ncbi:MAG: RNA 2',3'-cyclic phosphodiesterase [Elusimicrobia bacterium]|nr:RNA 2',3'-cyclic phosphodiesterase [Elusimicrobiota bacterium]